MQNRNGSARQLTIDELTLIFQRSRQIPNDIIKQAKIILESDSDLRGSLLTLRAHYFLYLIRTKAVEKAKQSSSPTQIYQSLNITPAPAANPASTVSASTASASSIPTQDNATMRVDSANSEVISFQQLRASRL